MSESKLLHAYYDTRYAPLTFDFATYLVILDSVRQHLAFDSINLSIFRSEYRNNTIREVSYSSEIKDWRFKHIILGMTNMLPSISSVTWDRFPPKSVAVPHFPVTYPPRNENEAKNSIPYLTNFLLKFRDSNVNLLPFTATTISQEYVATLANLNQTEKLVTITLRTSNQQKERNSNIGVWFALHTRLCEAGYRCIVIPDFEDLVESSEACNYDWDLFLPAVFDLDIRLALYSKARMNLCVLNGVVVPLLHSPYPYMVFKPRVDAIHQTRLPWLKNIFGIEEGESFWWSQDNQRVVWMDDDSPDAMFTEIKKNLISEK